MSSEVENEKSIKGRDLRDPGSNNSTFEANKTDSNCTQHSSTLQINVILHAAAFCIKSILFKGRGELDTEDVPPVV